MKEVILITGANGLIAKELSDKLSKAYTIKLLTRKKRQQNEFEWDVDRNLIDDSAVIGVDHIIHLAGANISEKRWTEQRKKEIISSRVKSAHLLLEALERNNIKIKSFISASAVGFYGTTTTENIYTETAPKGTDFLSDVVAQWEQSADLFAEKQRAERVVKLRTGVVLSHKGGALAKMKLPIHYYVGAALGKGNQYMPWIHIDDLCSIYEYSLQNPNINGVYNATAPTHITNKELTEVIAHNLKKSLWLPNIPSFLIWLIFGETSVIILTGSRVSSNKIQSEDFRFKYPELESALKDLL